MGVLDTVDLFSRAVPLTMASALTNNTAPPKSFRLPEDAMRAKFAWQTIPNGNVATIAMNLEGTLDGINWSVVDSTNTNTGEIRNLLLENLAGVRVAAPTITGGGNITVIGRIQ
jgi:hypothetical protein